MAEPQTYAELQTAVIAWLIRDDLDALAPNFIGMAERRFNRVLRVPEMEIASRATVSSGVVTLPDDFLEARSIWVDADPKVVLQPMALAQLKRAYSTSASDTPRNFALQGGNQIVFGPEPSDDTAIVLNYYQAIPALSDSTTTNWLLTAYPDLYMAAALVEGFMYVRDTAQAQLWEARTSAMMAELERQSRKKAYGGPLVLRAEITP